MRSIHVRLLLLIFVFILGIGTANVYCQESEDSIDVVQLSGQIFIDDNNQLETLPFVSVFIKTQPNRGTYSDENGFFSIVAEIGETVVFSGLGLEEAELVVPDTLRDNRYSVIQLMTSDTINLPETVIYPWPSREHFKVEFLAMNVNEPLVETAMKNLSDENLRRVDDELEPDGREATSLYFKQQAQETYSAGQIKPQRIFSPLAWSKFFKAWKDGDFKREKKDE